MAAKPAQRPKTSFAFPGPGHDHERCIAEAIAAAAELCTARRVRLTDTRRRVLELVWRSHAPIGAYELLDILRSQGRRAAPPTVYRALDFLLAQGLVHRIESRNAFIGCINPRQPHDGQYLICRECGTLAELADAAISRNIARHAKNLGFRVDHQTVEVAGLCGCCADMHENGDV